MLSALAMGAMSCAAEDDRPNIIFILADDMGSGDITALNPNSKIATPNLDRMAAESVVFTDAHTSSSVSTPTRYGVLTGRYNWRSNLKSGVLSGFSKPLIPTTRATMATKLQQGGYTTGYIGKWHLGWGWNYSEQPADGMIDKLSSEGKGVIDYSQPITGGPNELGFDHSYGFCGSLDMAPYVYVENGLATTTSIHQTSRKDRYGWWRNGDTGEDFVHEDVFPNLTDHAIDFVKERANGDKPFFLYLPYPSPHTPILPTKEWQDKSGINPYADFVMMVDAEVGRLLDSLDELGIGDNTLIVFTTDNGCSPAAKIEELTAKGHYPNYPYRGTKADLFEGGHRVPCLVRWRDGFASGVSQQTICLTDFYSTFAQIAGVEVADNEGEDSFSLLSVLRDPSIEEPLREATIHHSISGEFAIRSGDWKLLVSPSSGGWSYPAKGKDNAIIATLPPMQLYNMREDIAETTNLYEEHPEIVERLLQLLREQILNGRSTEGENQQNEQGSEWKQLDVIFK